MANRAYLYSANSDLTKLRDLSESTHPIPLVYKIILGVNTEICNSKIWDFEHPIAIRADFQKGINRLYDFFEYLKTQAEIDLDLISGFEKETKDFFEVQKERVLDLFFLESGEIFDLISDVDPLEKQNEMLYNEIVSISTNLNKILSEKPVNLFDSINSYWVKQIKDDLNVLSVYWTHVTYFSFNKS